MKILGIKFIGLNNETASKILLTFLIVVLVFILKELITRLVSYFYRTSITSRMRFWTGQSINLTAAVIIAISLLSLWFDDPEKLATGLGLVTAGLAFALQKVVTSFAGYLVIMRGNSFNVGERVIMGGVRGDVLALGFLQTTIMEMGLPSSVEKVDPAMWVRGRQFTGRIVTITNDKIFESPVYNFTRDFPFIWEEMTFPLSFHAPRKKAEEIIVEAAAYHTQEATRVGQLRGRLFEYKYGLTPEDIEPKVFMRLTPDWLELTVRFIVYEHGIRDIKDAITRDVLDAFEEEGILVASPRYEVRLSDVRNHQLHQRDRENQ
jgi:small-conductance mechanosensitive channel